MSLRPVLAVLVVLLVLVPPASAATATSTTLSSSPNPSVTAAKVTFSATVAPATAAGSVRFFSDGSAIGTAAISGGTAKLTTSSLSVGSHSITARYLGNTSYTASTSPAVTQTVNKASTSVTLTSSPNPSGSGENVDFTATVAAGAPSTGTPGGTVRFYEGATQRGSATLSGGVATFSTAALASGSHTLTATYAGNAKYTSSTSGPVTQQVDRVTTVTLTSSRNPSTVGDAVTFTATLSPSSATGAVSFADGGTDLGSAAVSGGSASITTSSLSEGSHSVVASYGGDATNPAGASAPLSQQVDPVGSPPPPPPPGGGPMALISRGVPAFTNDSCGGSYPASNANDADYESAWTTCSGRASATSPKWLAYDLSGVPAAKRGKVLVAWFNDPITSEYDHTVVGSGAYDNVGAFTIQVNSAPGGGAAPTIGWADVYSASANTFHSRQALIDMTGDNWVRLLVTAADGQSGATDIALNMDVHDAGAGATDDWMFYGDSITQDGLFHDSRTAAGGARVGTFADLVAAAKPGYYPLFEDGGIGGLRSAEGAANVAKWLTLFPGRYVTLDYGTNDATASAGDTTIVKPFHDNMRTMVQAVLAAGKVPIIPTIPWGRTSSLQANVPVLNGQIAALESEFPQIVPGPDLYAYFKANQSLISSDGIHPTWDNGYAALRRQWAQFAAGIEP